MGLDTSPKPADPSKPPLAIENLKVSILSLNVIPVATAANKELHPDPKGGAVSALQQGCPFLLLLVVTQATATLLFLLLFSTLAAAHGVFFDVFPHQTRFM